MYMDWYQDIMPKEAWYISNNYYYNKLNVPSQYSDTNANGGSRAAETLDLSMFLIIKMEIVIILIKI